MLSTPTMRRGLAAATLAFVMAISVPAAAQENSSAALGRNLRVLATDPRNFDALVGAGRAALDMGDVQSAAGFFGRAQDIRPNDWRALVGVGGAMVQMGDPRGAIQRFDAAQRAGAPVSSFAIDRGMARDLLGDPSGAQADYRAALGGRDDEEARRRLALSLAISRKKKDAIDAIQPLLNRRDPGAQRSRAFVLALVGDRRGAAEAIEAVMPGTSAQFEKFFQYLPNLTAGEKAAAVHLGVFPEDAATRVAVAEPVEPPVQAAPPARVASVSPPLARSGNPAGIPPSTKRASPPTARPVATPATSNPPKLVARTGRGASERPTLRQELEDKEVRNVLAERGARREADTSPAVTLPSQVSAEPIPAPAPEEPLVVVDTTPAVPAEAAVDSTVTNLPGGSEGPVLPVEEVRLSGIDKLLATIADPAPPPKPRADDRAAKAAAAKKLADRKAAEAKAASERKAREEAARLGAAGTHWVQLAGGSNRNFMSTEYRKLSGKSSLLRRRNGYVTEGKDYFRLVVGPFDSKSDAQAFVNKLAKDGVDGFSWTRTPAQIKIEKLP